MQPSVVSVRSRMISLRYCVLPRHVPLHGLEAIRRDGKIAGFIRRADYAHALGKSIAYGYVVHHDGEVVTMDYLRSGMYQLEHMGALLQATLHTKSPFDPSNKRVKGVYE